MIKNKHFKIKVLFFMSGMRPDRLLISAKYVRVLRRGSVTLLLHPLQSLPYLNTNKKSFCDYLFKGRSGIDPTTALARRFCWRNCWRLCCHKRSRSLTHSSTDLSRK